MKNDPASSDNKSSYQYTYWTPARTAAISVAGACLLGAGVLSLLQRRMRSRYLSEQQLRREHEAIAALNGERFRLASEAINGLIYDWDVPTDAVLRTRGLTELLGYSPNEDVDNREWWREQIHPDDRPRTDDMRDVILDSEQGTYELEYRVRHKLGHYITVQDKGRVVRDEFGKPLRVVGCTVDVTPQRQADRARRQSEERLRLAVTGADLGTWHWNLQTGAMDLSPRARDFFGIEGDVEVTVERFFCAAPAEDREWVRAAAHLAIEQRSDYDIEHRVEMPDGSRRWIAVRGLAYYTGDGQPLNMEGVVLDITERHQAIHEIEKLNIRLQRAIAESHHRIKNNLQTLAALAEMQTLNGTDVIPREAFERLCQHIRTLANLHDLLTQEIREARDVETISARSALDRLLTLLNSVTQDRTVTLVASDERLPLKQAGSFSLLVNELVSNSVKHGQGEIIVRLEPVAIGKDSRRMHLKLEVADSGPGFPEGFDPTRAANTGLELVESIGRWDLQGEVQYGNRTEGGAVVIVTFPAAI